MATTTDPTGGTLAGLDGGGVYNLFLTYAGGAPGGGTSDDLGIDLSSTNDSNLTGYTFCYRGSARADESGSSGYRWRRPHGSPQPPEILRFVL